MKTPEDLLQDRLEQLEAGIPLAQCQQGLASDDADLLALASQLRHMRYPVRTPQTVKQQRANLIQIAQKEQKMNPTRVVSRPRWAFPALGVTFAAAFLFLCLVAAALSSGYYLTRQQPDNPAVINALAGIVELQGEATWTGVTSATTVEVGQHIRTAPGATALLALPDGSLVYLGSDTEIWIEQLETKAGERTIRLAQWSGETRHDVAPATVAYSSYEVETPTGISQAKGTVFSVFVPSSDQTRVTVLEGTVEVNGSDGQETVAAGKMTTLNRSQPPQTPSYVVIGEGIIHEEADHYLIAGKTFAIHDGTIVAPDVQSGSPVYVEGHIGTDGVYYADSISTSRGTGAFMGSQFTGDVAAAQTEQLDCVTIASVIVDINGTLITLEDGTLVDLAEVTVLEGTPAVGSAVLLVTCMDDAGNVVAIIFIVLDEPPGEPTPTPTATIPVTITVTPSGNGTVTLCHYPPGNPSNGHTITVGAAAVPAHLAHGDILGPCGGVPTATVTPTVTITPTATITPTMTVTATATIIATPTVTVTITPTSTVVPTETVPPTVTPQPPATPTPGNGDATVTICHIPAGNPNNAHTITVSQSALAAHLAHGDTLGACPANGGSNGNNGNGNGNGNGSSSGNNNGNNNANSNGGANGRGRGR